jgi:hypothetical protein
MYKFVRKDSFIRKLCRSKEPVIVKDWEYEGMIDGLNYVARKLPKDVFLQYYGPGTRNYEIMRVTTTPDRPGWFDVYDRYGGAIYCFAVFIPEEAEESMKSRRKSGSRKRKARKRTRR